MNLPAFSFRLVTAGALLILLGWALSVTALLFSAGLWPGEDGDFVTPHPLLTALLPAGLALVCALVMWKARGWLFPAPK